MMVVLPQPFAPTMICSARALSHYAWTQQPGGYDERRSQASNGNKQRNDAQSEALQRL